MNFGYLFKFLPVLFSVVTAVYKNRMNRTFTVEAGKVECFYKNLRRNDVMFIKYMVTEAENNNLTISFRLTAPLRSDGSSLITNNNSTDGNRTNDGSRKKDDLRVASLKEYNATLVGYGTSSPSIDNVDGIYDASFNGLSVYYGNDAVAQHVTTLNDEDDDRRRDVSSRRHKAAHRRQNAAYKKRPATRSRRGVSLDLHNVTDYPRDVTHSRHITDDKRNVTRSRHITDDSRNDAYSRHVTDDSRNDAHSRHVTEDSRNDSHSRHVTEDREWVIIDHQRNVASHEVRANVSGEYRFCFINRFDNTSYKTVYLNFYTYTPPLKNIAFTVCGSRLNESLNLIKSALVFTKTPIRLIIFTEQALKQEIVQVLIRWRALTKNQLSFELCDVTFPEEDKKYWLAMLPQCSAQRLFVPELLPHIDALIYLDTDTLFLAPPDDLWYMFLDLNARQAAALVAEHNNASRKWAWYPRFAKYPFYGEFGLNTGVMLMNLTRLRAVNWTNQVTSAASRWKRFLRRGAQDIINIIFSSRPELVLELSCQFNFRSGGACPGPARGGIRLLHGSRGVFHGHGKHFFQAVYQALDSYEVGSNPLTSFLPALRASVRRATHHMRNSTSALHRVLNLPFLQVPIETALNMYHN